MAQYINKDDLVAKIIKLDGLNCLESPTIIHNEDYKCGYSQALEKVRDFIDTLEVKEVDFEKEVSIEWDKCNPVDEGMGCEFANISIEQFYSIIKHFFELGLKAQKGK